MSTVFKSVLFLFGTAALAAFVAPTPKSRADTPAEKKAKDADKKAKEAEKKAWVLRLKQETEAAKKAMEIQKKNWENQIKTMAKNAVEVQERQQASTLMSTYLLISAANSDYEGHREKAMLQVKSALILVDAAGMKQSESKIKAIQDLNNIAAVRWAAKKGQAFESQVLSDSQLSNAFRMLQGLVPFMSATKAAAPLGHVQNAMQEITAALQTSTLNSIKGREADVLTFAYILLEAANHDYAGHRVNAKDQVRHACKILEVDLLNNAPLDQKIKAFRDDRAAAWAKMVADGTPAIHERQYVSDVQLLMADALIQRVGYFLTTNYTQPVILRYLRIADKEIGLALMSR